MKYVRKGTFWTTEKVIMLLLAVLNFIGHGSFAHAEGCECANSPDMCTSYGGTWTGCGVCEGNCIEELDCGNYNNNPEMCTSYHGNWNSSGGMGSGGCEGQCWAYACGGGGGGSSCGDCYVTVSGGGCSAVTNGVCCAGVSFESSVSICCGGSVLSRMLPDWGFGSMIIIDGTSFNNDAGYGEAAGCGCG